MLQAGSCDQTYSKHASIKLEDDLRRTLLSVITFTACHILLYEDQNIFHSVTVNEVHVCSHLIQLNIRLILYLMQL